MSKIYGVTVGTPMKPQKVIEKTKLEERVDKLSKDIADLKQNGSGGGGSTDCVNVKDFGAIGDGATDDTDAINNALRYAIENGKELVFEPKTYLVIANQTFDNLIKFASGKTCFIIGENERVSINLNGATIKTGKNNLDATRIFLLFKANGVYIKNGTLVGDRDTNSITDDSSVPILLYDSKNVTLEGITSCDSRGDGFFIGGVEKGQTNGYYEFEDFVSNIHFANCTATNNRRNGLTITKGRGLFFERCVFEKSNGQLPEGGVDIEPNYGFGNVFDVVFRECTFKDNNECGMYGQLVENLIIDKCFFYQDMMLRNVVRNQVTNSIIKNKCILKNADCIISGNYIEPYEKGAENPTNYVAISLQPDKIGIPIKPIVIISNNFIRGNIFGSTGNTDSHDSLVIIDNIIESYTDGEIISITHTYKMYDNGVTIKNNKITRCSKKTASNSTACFFNIKYEDFDFIGNELINDTISAYWNTKLFGNLLNTSKSKIIDNKISVLKKQEGVYDTHYKAVIELTACEGISLMFNNNVINAENITINDNITCIISDVAVEVNMNNNYLYGLKALVDTNTTLKSCVNNILNNALYTLTTE